MKLALGLLLLAGPVLIPGVSKLSDPVIIMTGRDIDCRPGRVCDPDFVYVLLRDGSAIKINRATGELSTCAGLKEWQADPCVVGARK